jgi:uncharacterized protein with von Willebrand factor type A (vWA) domain
MVGALRSHGVRIGTGETVDAGRAVEALGLADRELLREGPAARLLHNEGQRRVFDALFDGYFPARIGVPATEAPADREGLRDVRSSMSGARACRRLPTIGVRLLRHGSADP